MPDMANAMPRCIEIMQAEPTIRQLGGIRSVEGMTMHSSAIV
eukprot:CAMPEP_0195045132 /NCGR_PEP_ID=MMETSP0347-20130606/13224_1 /TAXON_ID=2932 /ORGANISM="Alexandrium fundyense, Strain CCMP1719" /LENGTH=41 /DNA_ID= /DNA_START= /DNA_END= /DNA_ORIENTATION=